MFGGIQGSINRCCAVISWGISGIPIPTVAAQRILTEINKETPAGVPEAIPAGILGEIVFG